jgi:hypothetical protein
VLDLTKGMNKPMFSETVYILPRISISICGIVKCLYDSQNGIMFRISMKELLCRVHRYSSEAFHGCTGIRRRTLSFPSRC